ncbi:hypothetical protein FZI85_06165 [Mycobacterium sp. CBMA293]|uniref:hypothetical protein n=1 Tax=unclassified Mycolicibacterium TaxID=2636767 RepID=UPI0012DE09B4|nr:MULTISPECIES: hypothetical protein [unclassified Mycolicibacterium]MUL45156.1 hypothetical protein [Mycolicibacterium sp. CBMA 360]MUL56674.1 hypothetical protein [Mycolicibacterium sp. CBMA 335]MUL69713.1 hypothetical protein [Mycolicibacterium sp. CBMA 311]MUL91761.1 hypothetical protein [Mycolicibacterium sp. CBMA 230]MUM05500.1 hypothetical protein [Mycolicibacterium sp. CBMA 213]
MTITIPLPQAPIGATDIDDWDEWSTSINNDDHTFSADYGRTVAGAVQTSLGIRVRTSALQSDDGTLDDAPCVVIDAVAGTEKGYISLSVEQARAVIQMLRQAAELAEQWAAQQRKA